jgi:hypothetical protein
MTAAVGDLNSSRLMWTVFGPTAAGLSEESKGDLANCLRVLEAARLAPAWPTTLRVVATSSEFTARYRKFLEERRLEYLAAATKLDHKGQGLDQVRKSSRSACVRRRGSRPFAVRC